MIQIRPSEARGHAEHGWLDTYHTFSFARYYDPQHMGFGSLRVINEDRIAPSGGFGMHPHEDMEILTYVLEGALEHRDSMGHGSVIHAGDTQRMSAGTGVMHSEYNASDESPLHLLQIWILPERKGITPSYQERIASGSDETLELLASRDGRDGSLLIHQDCDLWLARLKAGGQMEAPIGEGHRAWLQVMRGSVSVNGTSLSAGDGAAVSEESTLQFASDAGAEFLLFDLA